MHRTLQIALHSQIARPRYIALLTLLTFVAMC
jgi:hypothetical protein